MEVLIFFHTVMDGHQRKINALAYMKKLESFESIYSMVTLLRSLLYCKLAAVNLYGKNKDIISGVSTDIQSCEELK